jgi:hypothetical protein
LRIGAKGVTRDEVDAVVVDRIDDIWAYANRTLTQEKFPFWSAIINQTAGSVSSPANSTVSIVIQPPSGEVWLVWIDVWLNLPASASAVTYNDYDGTTAHMHTRCAIGGTYGLYNPKLGLLKVLTNSLYARIDVLNPTTGTSTGAYYGYSGFKLSQPLWSPKRGDRPVSPWKKPTGLPLPSAISALDKYKAEILGLDPSKPNEYGLAVILEEDTPLALDPTSGFPVERFTAVVKADVLADLIAKFKAGTLSPDVTGYRKYLDKWKAEGIDLGV